MEAMTISLNGSAFKCGNEHSLFCEAPPTLAVRQFFSWGQKGLVEIYGGQAGRPFYVYCWLHDTSFSSIGELDKYLLYLDKLAGTFGTVQMLSGGGMMQRYSCRFLGFRRIPFPGQDHPQILPVLGPDTSSYGNYHIAGELHFFQLSLDQ